MYFSKLLDVVPLRGHGTLEQLLCFQEILYQAFFIIGSEKATGLAGLYIIRLETQGRTISRKVVLSR